MNKPYFSKVKPLILLLSLGLLACENQASVPADTANATKNTPVQNAPKPAIQKNTLTAIFLNQAQSNDLLASEDDYIRNLSKFDWQAKFHSDRPVSAPQRHDYYAKTTLNWDDDSRQKVATAVQFLQQKIAPLNLNPYSLKFILSQGLDEAGSAYTRADYIVLPRDFLQVPQAEINRLVAHEFFHVYSREHRANRDKIYAAIGFERMPALQLPASIENLRISNPDATNLDYAIDLIYQGKSAKFVPFLHANRPYDKVSNLSFFEYLKDKLLMVKVENGKTVPVLKNGKPIFVKIADTNFDSVVQPNSDYIHQPEEILAENFSYWVVDEVKNPAPVEKLIQVMKVIR